MSNIVKAPAMRPIKLGCFTLTEDGMDVDGRPTFEDYVGTGDFIQRSVKASGWWLADWLDYGDKRPEWKDKIAQAFSVGDSLTPESQKQYRHVRRRFPPEKRVTGVAFGHHAAIAKLKLSDEERQELLEKAKAEHWTQSELRDAARGKRRANIIEGQAVLEGMFRVLYCDAPWAYNDSGIPESGALGKASRHYKSMSIEELCALPVKAHSHENSVLFMWIPAPLILQNPGPREVIEAWGFTHKSGIVWDKILHSFGHYVGVHHEHLLICTRGSCLPDQPLPLEDSVQTIRRGDVHSEKPEHFRELIMKHWTTGPYLELFARKRVEGWSCFGDDARLWATEMQASA